MQRKDVSIKSLYIHQLSVFLIMVLSSSTLRNVRLSIVVTSAAVISLLFLPLTVFAQLEEEEGGVAAQANDTAAANATATGGSNNMTGVTFLFIQHAQSGSVSEINATTSTLELSDVSDKTIMFSDRPDRIVASIDTTDFVGNWSMGPDSFAADPPNAVLILDDEVEQRQDIAIIELFNPEYDSEADTLTYDITAENATATTTSSSINLPNEFGQSTLVIDPGGDGTWEYEPPDRVESGSIDNGLIDRPS